MSLKKIVYVYSPDGKTLIHTYKDVVSLTREDHNLKLKLENDAGNSTVTFSDIFPYYEISLNLEFLNKSSLKVHSLVSSVFFDKFLNELILLDIIHKTASMYSCNLIGMPKVRGRSGILDWLISNYDPKSSRNTLEDIVEKLYNEYHKRMDNSNLTINSYY